MKVSELIKKLSKLSMDAEVKLGIYFTRDAAEDEGYAFAPVVKLSGTVNGLDGEEIVVIDGSEDASVADVAAAAEEEA